jgi:hypothetical protein
MRKLDYFIGGWCAGVFTLAAVEIIVRMIG